MKKSIGLAAAVLLCASPAFGETLTRQSCIDRLTTDPAGPKLKETAIRIGTVVTIEGVPYQFWEGTLIEDVCDAAVRRSKELALKDHQIVTLQADVAKAIEQGAKDAALRRSLENDIVRSNPYEVLMIVVFVTAIVSVVATLLIKFVLRCVRWLGRRIFNRRRRFYPSSRSHLGLVKSKRA